MADAKPQAQDQILAIHEIFGDMNLKDKEDAEEIVKRIREVLYGKVGEESD
jgi:hypothetical protein